MRGNFIDTIENRLLLRLAAFRRRRVFESDPVDCQERLLSRLLKRCCDTAFGRRYSFHSIDSVGQFLTSVGPNSYADLKPWIDRVFNGEKDVLFAGRPACFGTTSGTEGQAKLIPQNRAMLRDARMGAIDAALIGGLSRKSMLWHNGKALYIGPRKASHTDNWNIFAEGTAFVYLQAAPFRARFVPKYEHLPANDENADYGVLIERIKTNRITMVAGNPLEIADFLRATKTVMPQVEIVINCGYWALDQENVYKNAFVNATVLDVYGSNEGIWGLPVSLGRFLLNFRRVFFSFVALGTGDKAISFKDVQPGRKYRLCVTTSGGLWNYMTGDVVCFESITPPVFRLCGRSGRILPLGDDWLTENEVVTAVHGAGLNITRYCLSKEGRGCILYVDGDIRGADVIDQNLCRLNSGYARMRSSGELVKLIVRRRNMNTGRTAKSAKIEVEPHLAQEGDRYVHLAQHKDKHLPGMSSYSRS